MVEALPDGGIALLENLRFHAGEEKNDKTFADELAALGEVYVNDAFSASHRAHASITGLAERLPAYAGRLMQAELEALEAALGGSQRPTAALIGGAKVSSKLEVLGHVLDRVDVLIIGGGMANTFLNAKGVKVGKSLCEHDLADTAREIMAKAQAKNVRIILPDDAVVAAKFEENAATRTIPVGEVGDADMILDIGPKSAEATGRELERCRTLLWNGPLGAFEIRPSMPARTRWRRKQPSSPSPASCRRWPAAATRWRPWRTRACWRTSPTSRRLGERSSSGWKARSCRGWRRSGRSRRVRVVARDWNRTAPSLVMAGLRAGHPARPAEPGWPAQGRP